MRQRLEGQETGETTGVIQVQYKQGLHEELSSDGDREEKMVSITPWIILGLEMERWISRNWIFFIEECV